MIAINAVLMGFEVDLARSGDVGWYVLENFFCILWISEMILKLKTFRFAYFQSSFNVRTSVPIFWLSWLQFIYRFYRAPPQGSTNMRRFSGPSELIWRRLDALGLTCPGAGLLLSSSGHRGSMGHPIRCPLQQRRRVGRHPHCHLAKKQVYGSASGGLVHDHNTFNPIYMSSYNYTYMCVYTHMYTFFF